MGVRKGGFIMTTTAFIINLYCPQCGKQFTLENSTVYHKNTIIAIIEGVIIVNGCELKLTCKCGFHCKQGESLEVKSRVKLFSSLEEDVKINVSS